MHFSLPDMKLRQYTLTSENMCALLVYVQKSQKQHPMLFDTAVFSSPDGPGMFRVTAVQ